MHPVFTALLFLLACFAVIVFSFLIYRSSRRSSRTQSAGTQLTARDVVSSISRLLRTFRGQGDAFPPAPCYYHEQRQTVLRCGGCDAPLCTECAVRAKPLAMYVCHEECREKLIGKLHLRGIVWSTALCYSVLMGAFLLYGFARAHSDTRHVGTSYKWYGPNAGIGVMQHMEGPRRPPPPGLVLVSLGTIAASVVFAATWMRATRIPAVVRTQKQLLIEGGRKCDDDVGDTSEPRSSISGSVRDRLAALEQLKSDGVITEDEYASKRANILGDL
jgi:hypothetical protein